MVENTLRPTSARATYVIPLGPTLTAQRGQQQRGREVDVIELVDKEAFRFQCEDGRVGRAVKAYPDIVIGRFLWFGRVR